MCHIYGELCTYIFIYIFCLIVSPDALLHEISSQLSFSNTWTFVLHIMLYCGNLWSSEWHLTLVHTGGFLFSSSYKIASCMSVYRTYVSFVCTVILRWQIGQCGILPLPPLLCLLWLYGVSGPVRIFLADETVFVLLPSMISGSETSHLSCAMSLSTLLLIAMLCAAEHGYLDSFFALFVELWVLHCAFLVLSCTSSSFAEFGDYSQHVWHVIESFFFPFNTGCY